MLGPGYTFKEHATRSSIAFLSPGKPEIFLFLSFFSPPLQTSTAETEASDVVSDFELRRCTTGKKALPFAVTSRPPSGFKLVSTSVHVTSSIRLLATMTSSIRLLAIMTSSVGPDSPHADAVCMYTRAGSDLSQRSLGNVSRCD